MVDHATEMIKCQDYVEALENERGKIEVFQRELPLCLELVNQAIDTCKQQLVGTTTYTMTESDWSEQTSSEGPVLAEFIPIKRTSCDDEEGDKCVKENKNNENGKSDWLRSVQLWNQTPDPVLVKDFPRKTSTPVEIMGNVDKMKEVTSGGSNRKEDKDETSNRKHRRCWSLELHRRFLHALQQLGGSHVATPKQIRELMKVDGLTNDEVKSHLQKYRLHTRRPIQAMHSNGGNSSPSQFVVVGGIWVPPKDYATSRIYVPEAAISPATPSAKLQVQQEERGSHSEEGGGGFRSNSPASSSTHTTTASQLFPARS